MKKKLLTISIPKPCSQKWDEMQPADNGRFCASCQKTVIDFTTLTDAEINNIFKTAGDKPPCGRYLASQLNREIAARKSSESFSVVLLKRIAASLMFFQSLAVTAWAQTIKPKTEQLPNAASRTAPGATRSISGFVKDHITGEPLNGMTVQVAGTDLTTTTGISGAYSLSLPDTLTLSSIVLQVRYSVLSGGCPDGTIIPDVEVSFGKNAVLSGIVLWRYPEEMNTPVLIKEYAPPIVDNIVLGGVSYTSEALPTPKSSSRKASDFFKRKRRK